MLSISPKPAKNIDADLAKPVKTHLKALFPEENPTQIDSAAEKLGSTRQELLRAIDNGQPWHVVEPIFYNYYNMITSLSGRARFYSPSLFDSLKKPDPQKGIPFNFVYGDSLIDTSKYRTEPVSVSDGDFERLVILFNLAASMSQEAIRLKNSDQTKGLAPAQKLFREAASVLSFVSKDLKLCVAGQRYSKDVSPQVCEFFSTLFLAQVQVCYFEKAAQAQLSPTTVAKLAAGAALLFFNATKLADGGASSYLRACKTRWDSYAAFQYNCFRATASWWWSKPMNKERQYGEEVAFLRRANYFIRETMKFDNALSSSFHSALLASRNVLLEAIETRLEAATEDNNKVYFRLVPDEIPEVEAITKADIMPFQEIFNTASKTYQLSDPFNFLISPEMKSEVEAITADLDTLVSNIISSATTQSDELRKALNEMALPASIDAILSYNGLPAELTSSLASIRATGGVASLLRLVDQVTSNGVKAIERVESVQQRLDDEAKRDKQLHDTYGSRCTRQVSATLTGEYTSQIETLLTILKQAQQSDQLLARELKANEEELRRLDTDLTRDIPQSANTLGNDPVVKALQTSLNEATVLMKQRDDEIEKFKSITSTGSDGLNVLNAYVTDPTGRSTLKSQLTDKIHAASQGLLAFNTKQTELLNKIREQNTEFNQIKSKNTASEAREKALQRINVAITLALRLRSNLEEGSRFYSELTRNNIEPLEFSVTDFLIAREKEYLEHDQYLSSTSGNPFGA